MDVNFDKVPEAYIPVLWPELGFSEVGSDFVYPKEYLSRDLTVPIKEEPLSRNSDDKAFVESEVSEVLAEKKVEEYKDAETKNFKRENNLLAAKRSRLRSKVKLNELIDSIHKAKEALMPIVQKASNLEMGPNDLLEVRKVYLALRTVADKHPRDRMANLCSSELETLELKIEQNKTEKKKLKRKKKSE